MTAHGTHEDTYGVAGAVVVGVDGSDSSRDALIWAAEHAHLAGRRLVAITAWELPASYGAIVGWSGGVNFEQDARTILSESVAKSLGDEGALKLTQKVIHSHPAPVLVEASKHAALVVVGCRGHGEFSGMLLGSVSQYLATHAECPVVIVRHREPRD